MKELGSKQIIFDKMTAVRTKTIFCICRDSAFMGQSSPTTAFDLAISYFACAM